MTVDIIFITYVYSHLPSWSYNKMFIVSFPELFWTVLFDRSIPFSDRIKYYLTLIGIWPVAYKLGLKLK